jgi:hypothetical protein
MGGLCGDRRTSVDSRTVQPNGIIAGRLLLARVRDAYTCARVPARISSLVTDAVFY